jgi:Domain of unknown function (DUF6378)
MSPNRLNKILEERLDEYGDAHTEFTAIGRVWAGFLKLEDDIPAYQVALMMDALKSVRLFHNPFKDDSWLDKEGYIKHGKEIIGIE